MKSKTQKQNNKKARKNVSAAGVKRSKIKKRNGYPIRKLNKVFQPRLEEQAIP